MEAWIGRWKRVALLLVLPLSLSVLGEAHLNQDEESGSCLDLLTPAYYEAGPGDAFRLQIDQFLACVREISFSHPFGSSDGNTQVARTPDSGHFCSLKGRGRDVQYHPAIDLYPPDGAEGTSVFAAHGGEVTTYRDAAKYRHYISVTQDVRDPDGVFLGRMVTIYAHVDLDRDEDAGLFMDGKLVEQGDQISQHLLADTVGGPHLHFETRYYRPEDSGTESFYGSRVGPSGSSVFESPSAGPWSAGYWDPEIGFGFGNPCNHGLNIP